MNSKDTFSKINEIEKRINLSSYEIDNLNIWPIIRLHIGYINDSYLPKKPAGKKKELFKKAIQKIYNFPFRYTSYLYNIISDYKKNDIISERDFLYITYGTSRRIRLERGFYDVYLDPFIEIAKEKGKSYLVLEYNSSKYFIPRYNKSVYISPIIDIIQLYSGFRARINKSKKIKKLVSELNTILEELGLNYIDEKVIINKVIFHRLLINYFERILIKVKPKAVFTSNFYGVEFSLIAACKKFEIPTIDIQHGSQSSIHYSYGHWEKIPNKGFELLPNIFWVWDKTYKKNKMSWILKNKNHQVLVGGNPIVFLDNYKDKILSTSKEELKLFTGSSNIKILISLDSESIGILDFYIELLDKLKNENIFWGFRFHPSTSDPKKQTIRNKICPYIDYNIDLFSQIPLFQVLSETTIHITETSSVILDAINFNIRSIIINQDSLIFYKEQIITKEIIYIDNITDIIKYINNIGLKKSEKKHHDIDKLFKKNVLNLYNNYS
tara:strand:- start:4109 stop:5596 length:1488 start_codon:yes stop_codon:yes gene_type:complete